MSMNLPELPPGPPALAARAASASELRPGCCGPLARASDVVRLAVLLAMVTPALACVAPASEDDAATGSETAAETDAPPGDTDEPTGGEPGPGCADAPVANAGFAVELDGWPATRGNPYLIEAQCTVTAVETVADEVVTTLECDDAGELRTATLRIAASDDGAPSWGPASAVTLVYDHLDDTDLGTGTYRALSLRRSDDQALLVAAIDADSLMASEMLGGSPGTTLAPLVTTEDRGYCGWGFESDPAPMAVGLALDGESLDLVNGQRGTLAIAGQTDRLAVDLAEATVGYCCHFLTWFRLLVRRVA